MFNERVGDLASTEKLRYFHAIKARDAEDAVVEICPKVKWSVHATEQA
jgi:hypothetical protein